MVREQTNHAVMFHSVNGKDSIALLDMLAKTFDEVTCVFMYFVKGFDHIERVIRRTESRYPNVKFVQIPHLMLSNIKKGGVFCEPDPNVKALGIKDIELAVRKKTGQHFLFSGMKGVDGFMKRMRLKMWGEYFTDTKGTVYPLALWTNKEVLQYIQLHNLQQPVDYSVLENVRVNKSGRKHTPPSNGIGFDVDVFLWLRKFYPQDLEMIYREYPLSRQILIRYDREQEIQRERDGKHSEKQA